MDKITVMIIHEQPFFRSRVRLVLSRQPDFKVLECDPTHDSLAMIESVLPDICLLGSDMATISVSELGKKITRCFPSTKVVTLSSDFREEELFVAITRATVACLNKNATSEDTISVSAAGERADDNQWVKVLESDHQSPDGSVPIAEEPDLLPELKDKSPQTSASPIKPQQTRLKQIPKPEALKLVPEMIARRYNAIPLAISGNTLQVAMANPTDVFALEALATISRMRIKPMAATTEEIREAIDFNYQGYGEIQKQISRISVVSDTRDEALPLDTAVDTPLTQALSLIIEEAVKARASDIHIEPETDKVRIRYRIDGTLQDTMSLPLNVHRSLISRIKVLSDLNIADHQHPQDGQFTTEAKGREIDIRVATAPTVSGEMAVLRLLDKSMAIMGLAELGMLPDTLARYEDIIKVAHGMILVSGPTGAGKTTTLYASINTLDKLGRNIITIEDPAEYRFKDINQIQVNTQARLTFASGLRSILRLDPDIIMVGEIRDSETASIAVQAALTGHVVLSSIHASDTPGVIFRLIDLKVEPFLTALSVVGVVAQRMVRRVCPDCARPIEAPAVERMTYERVMGERQSEFLYGAGCKSCAHTGYLGRTGIFEILEMSEAIRTMIVKQSSSADIRAQAVKEGMVPLMEDGMRKVKAGLTTPAEVLRAAYTLG